MGPLDVKGLLGAAIRSLMCGAGHVFNGHADFYLHHGTLRDSPSDEEFSYMLNQSCCLRAPHFPSLVVAEALQDYVLHY